MKLGVAVLLALAVVACDNRPSVWTAFVYKNSASLTATDTLTGFRSFEECQSMAVATLRSYEDPYAATYECGFKCEFNPAYSTHVCKETRR